jgi:lactate dehydrogenase-like 2-hydroxyacid dehydrogenase
MGKYQNIILKDKSDITPVVLERFPSASVLGAYGKVDTENVDNIKLISTKFSKVGKVTLDRYKNLEWVVCRAHGVDTVNIEECRKRNVGVVATAPTAKPCGEWICNKITDDDAILIFGNGSISKEVQSRIGNFNVVNSKTEQKEIDRYLKFCKTIVITMPLNKNTKNYFNRTLFSKIQNEVTIISIARGDLIDNGGLLEFSSSGKLKVGHFDMLSSDIRSTLVSQKNIRYYEHTSWEYNQPKDSKGKLGGYVNVEFADNLKKIIDNCLDNNVKDPHLKRLDNLWF